MPSPLRWRAWRDLPGYARWRLRLYGFYWPDGRFHWRRLFTRQFVRSAGNYHAWLGGVRGDAVAARSGTLLVCPRCGEQCAVRGGRAPERCPVCGAIYPPAGGVPRVPAG